MTENCPDDRSESRRIANDKMPWRTIGITSIAGGLALIATIANLVRTYMILPIAQQSARLAAIETRIDEMREDIRDLRQDLREERRDRQ